MRVGLRFVRIEPMYRLFKNNELYVGAARLSEVLESRLLVDWGGLPVMGIGRVKLPIGQGLRGEAAREGFLQRWTGLAVERSFGIERARWDGLVADYSFLATGDQPLGGGAYSLALGADALGGALRLGVQSVGPTGDGHAQGEASWTGVWRDGRWVRQLRLGDGFTTGPQMRSQRGFFVTNAPYLRPSLLGATRYDGQLDPGWTIEAYRGGDLVALDSTDRRGRFAVALRVRYGENPVDFIAYGPLGEVREFNRTYRVLSELLPVHQFEYGLSAGRCGAPTCRATGNLDLRYGVTSRWTVRAGLEQFWRDSLGNRTHPYVAMVVNPTNAWAVNLEAVAGASAGAGVQFEPSLNLQLAAGYTAYARDTAPAFQPAGLRSSWALTGFLRPIASSGFFYLDGQLGGTLTATGATTAARLGASIQAHDVRLVPFVRLQHHAQASDVSMTRPFAGLDLFALPRPGLVPLLGTV